MNYQYSMAIQWSQEDQLFLVHLPEFPWQEFHTHGKTYEEAARNGQVEMLLEEKTTPSRTKNTSSSYNE